MKFRKLIEKSLEKSFNFFFSEEEKQRLVPRRVRRFLVGKKVMT